MRGMNLSFVKIRDVASLTLLGLGLLFFNLNVHDYGDTMCAVGISGKTTECVLFHNGNSGPALGTDPTRFLIGTFPASIFALVFLSILSSAARFYSAVFSKFRERFLDWLSMVYRMGAA